jgi:hypothetical protein
MVKKYKSVFTEFRGKASVVLKPEKLVQIIQIYQEQDGTIHPESIPSLAEDLKTSLEIEFWDLYYYAKYANQVRLEMERENKQLKDELKNR